MERAIIASPLPIVRTTRQSDDLAAAFLLGYSGLTRAAYAADLRDFFAFLRHLEIDALDAQRVHVDLYARHLDEIEHRTPSTIARRLSTLSGYFRYAVAEDLIARSPVAHIRRPRVAEESPTTGLTKDELTRLLDAAHEDGPRSYALVSLLALNGLRVAEVLGADVGDLDHERGHRVLRITRKGGKKATVPLAPRTADALDALLAGRTDGPLFRTRTGKRLDQPATWRLVRRLARTANLPNADRLHPHSLRHAFVTLALDAGCSLRDVQDAAGHADPRTTRRYDRARHNLDRHPTYQLAATLA
jgi:site-specific recombinase XerD